MYNIIKTYAENFPAVRFIGKKYGNEDRVAGGFGMQWGTWFEEGWFLPLEALLTPEFIDSRPDATAYIGLMKCREGEPFQYWIGMFVPSDSTVPEGYDSVDFQDSSLGVCLIYGDEYDLFCKEEECGNCLMEAGYEIKCSAIDGCWFFERYACPRYTEHDEDGRIILDICHFIK